MAGPGSALGRIAPVYWRAGTRRSHEELAAVRERHVAAVRTIGAVLRAVAVDDDFGALGQGRLGQASAQQRVRRPAFDHPLLGLAVRVFDGHVDPRVRVDPLDAGDGSLELNWLVGVELRGERVMR